MTDQNSNQKNQNAADGEIISEFEVAKQAVLNDTLDNDEIKKFFVPLPYVVTNNGIKKIGKKAIDTICPRPIIITDKFYNLDDKTYKLTLAHLNSRQTWHAITPQDRGTILNKNKIVDCITYGLPINTGYAAKVVDYLLALELANEDKIPVTYTVNRCGWYTYKDNQYFIDPRITNTVKDGGKNINIMVDADNQMAKDLTTAGTLAEWRRAYLLAAKSTVARFNVAAALAPALLKILGERNFVVYTYGKTRGGKSTSLYLAASAVGNSGLVRVFNGTSNGLTAAAMNTNHYPFFVDEKQSADAKLKADYQSWIYNDGNGVERTRADKNGNPRPVKTWQHITICNGETCLLDDNSTGGAFTRILQIAAPKFLFADAADAAEQNEKISKEIREIIAQNYGHAYPLFVNHLQTLDADELRERYKAYQSVMAEFCKGNKIDIIPDYIRYVTLIFIADQILNEALNNDIGGLEYGQIFNMLPTTDKTEDSNREADSVNTFIGMYHQHFDNEYNKDPLKVDCYGKQKDGYYYIIATVLNHHLSEQGYTPSKVAADLVSSGYFIPADKTDSRHKTPPATVQLWINGKNQRCYRVKVDKVDNDADTAE